MARAHDQSVSEVVQEAVEQVVARLWPSIAEALEQAAASAPAPTAPSRTLRERCPGARGSRPRREITRWVADRNARRVPNFVIEATGLDTKKKIVAKFGENATFEKGKPLPKPAKAA